MKHAFLFALLFSVLTPTVPWAQTLVEDFSGPFPDWGRGWLREVAELGNYYGDGADRGNNPTGLWLRGAPGVGDGLTVVFEAEFGRHIRSIALEAACWQETVFFVEDARGETVYEAPCTENFSTPVNEYPHQYEVATPNGVSRWGFIGDSLAGNTAIDRLVITLSDSEHASDAPVDVAVDPDLTLLDALATCEENQRQARLAYERGDRFCPPCFCDCLTGQCPPCAVCEEDPRDTVERVPHPFENTN